MSTKELNVSVKGMTCNHCKKTVEEALMTLGGVNRAEVDLDNDMVKVVMNNDMISEKEVKDAITNIGYEVE